MSETSCLSLAKKIIAGYRIKRGDDLSLFLKAPLAELQEGARLLQDHFCGKHVDFCTIINGRSGHCGENCKYCAQAACHHTGIEEYGFLPQETILAHARANEAAGANRFAIVTSGRALAGRDFDRAIEAYEGMRATCHIDLCASHGLLTRAQLRRLHAAGVTSYHHNIETSRHFFPQICTSHTYDDRIRTIKMALMPIPGTGMEGRPQLPAADILRTIAFFRYINPTANIRLAAGRKLLPENGATALRAGASASITGNMLTTSGTTIKEDMAMIAALGLTNRTEDCQAVTGTCGAR